MKKGKYLNHRLNCLNHRLKGLNDFTDLKSKESIKSKNLCHLRNQNKSVIQTKNANILNSILELI
jgi:hypothetical protein